MDEPTKEIQNSINLINLLRADNMHFFTHLIHHSLMILRDNSHNYYLCYHVLMKFLHSSYHIVHKLNLSQIVVKFMHN